VVPSKAIFARRFWSPLPQITICDRARHKDGDLIARILPPETSLFALYVLYPE
jgi:hypothetical protein